jgi:hypothetical protein
MTGSAPKATLRADRQAHPLLSCAVAGGSPALGGSSETASQTHRTLRKQPHPALLWLPERQQLAAGSAPTFLEPAILPFTAPKHATTAADG